jgi:hypothetical protein
MKAYEGMGVWMNIFLTLALVEGEWSASRPGCFALGQRARGTHSIGGWMGSRAGLDDVEKRKFVIYRDSNSQPIASRYTDYSIPAPIVARYKLKSNSLRDF